MAADSFTAESPRKPILSYGNCFRSSGRSGRKTRFGYCNFNQVISLQKVGPITLLASSALLIYVIKLTFGLARVKQTGSFSGGSVVQNPPANAEDTGLIPGSGRCLGEGNCNTLKYSCLGNPIDRGAWRTIGHRVAKESDTT